MWTISANFMQTSFMDEPILRVSWDSVSIYMMAATLHCWTIVTDMTQ